MSEAAKKQLQDVGTWAFKGILSVAAAMAIFIFNDMRDSVGMIRTEMQDNVKVLREDVQTITDIVIRLDEKVDRNKEDIKRLEETKRNK